MRKFALAAVLLAAVSVASADVIITGDIAPGEDLDWTGQGNIRFPTEGAIYTFEQAGTVTMGRDNKVQLKGTTDDSPDGLIWNNLGTTTMGNFTGSAATADPADAKDRMELQLDVPTTINNTGTWALDAEIAHSQLRLQGGTFVNDGLFEKTGFYYGTIQSGPGTFENNGTIRIEEGTLIITDGNIAYTDAGEWQFVVDNGGEAPMWVVNSDVSGLNGDITVNLEDGDGGSFAQGEYLVASIANLEMAGYSFLAGDNVASTRMEIDGNDTLVYATAVPEPATMSLLALGGLAVLRRRRA